MGVVEGIFPQPLPRGGGQHGGPAHEGEGQELVAPAGIHIGPDDVALLRGHVGEHELHVGRAHEDIVADRGLLRIGEIVDGLVGPQRMAGKRDVPVACPLRRLHIGGNIVADVIEAFIVGADDFRAACPCVDRLHPVEGVVGLGVDEGHAIVGERVADGVIHGVGVKIAVNARDGDEHGLLAAVCEHHAVQLHAAPRLRLDQFSHSHFGVGVNTQVCPSVL